MPCKWDLCEGDDDGDDEMSTWEIYAVLPRRSDALLASTPWAPPLSLRSSGAIGLDTKMVSECSGMGRAIQPMHSRGSGPPSLHQQLPASLSVGCTGSLRLGSLGEGEGRAHQELEK